MPAEHASPSKFSVFPRKSRLFRKAFPTTFVGRRISSPHFTIIVPKDEGGLPAGRQGYAVVVPKKVARLSVTRHRIKRRILAALKKLSLPPSLIVFPRASVNSVDYQDIETELASLISNIHTKPNAHL